MNIIRDYKVKISSENLKNLTVEDARAIITQMLILGDYKVTIIVTGKTGTIEIADNFVYLSSEYYKSFPSNATDPTVVPIDINRDVLIPDPAPANQTADKGLALPIPLDVIPMDNISTPIELTTGENFATSPESLDVVPTFDPATLNLPPTNLTEQSRAEGGYYDDLTNETVVPAIPKKIKYRCTACKCIWKGQKRCVTKDD